MKHSPLDTVVVVRYGRLLRFAAPQSPFYADAAMGTRA